MLQCSFIPYPAWKQGKSISLSIYVFILSHICHFLTWTLFAVSVRYT